MLMKACFNLAAKKSSGALARNFAFFNHKISPKYGEKCCRYGLNGKPFTKERVDIYAHNLKSQIEGWRISEDYKNLYRYFYCEDYVAALTLIKMIGQIDGKSSQNLPNIHLTNGNLVKVELTSHPLKGISQIDFELAIQLSQLPFDELFIIPVEDPKNYRAEIRVKKQAQESEEFQAMLRSQAATQTKN